VFDVAPVIALSGPATIDVGESFALWLGAVSDPGQDTVNRYVVSWGDGSTETYDQPGEVRHVYATGPATRTVTVSLVDEDGTHAGCGNLSVEVRETVLPAIGDLQARAKPDKVQLAWTHVGAREYRVYRKLDGEEAFQFLASCDSDYSTYLDENVAAGKTYSYVVRPVTAGGFEQAESNLVTVRVPTRRP
jgi:hypothetical protein